MAKRILITAWVLFFVPAVTLAAQKIVDVDFVGLSSVEEGTARARIRSVEGSDYSGRQVKNDIKSLYQSGLFSDVSVKKELVPGGIKLIFTVVEKQIIGKLTITGNKKLSDEELTQALKIQEFELLDPARIAQTKTAIYKLYEEKGYYLVDVKSFIEPFDPEKNQVELIIRIKENKPVRIKRIKFLGNKHFSDGKLRKKMKTKEKGLFSFLSGSGKLEDEKLDVDRQLVRFFYLDNGFLHVKVGEPRITLTRDKKAIYISIPVHEGQRYKVSAVDVAGDILTTRQELMSRLSMKVGKTYQKSLEIKDLRELERIYGDQAYAFANIVPLVEADEASLTARVTYYIQKGPKIKIDRIIIKGNTVTRDKVIRREMRLVENSLYSQSALEMSRMRLYQLGYFEEVNISTPRGSGEDTVNIVVDVKEKSTGTFSVGAGFSTLESFIFTATVQKENFFGRGFSGAISANISKLRQDFVVSLSDRYFLDTKWYFGLHFKRFRSELNRDFDQDSFGGSVTFGREVFDFFHVRVGYEIDDLKVSNFSAQVPQFFQDNASGLTSAAVFALIYDRRDNRIFTKKGFYNVVQVAWSTESLGATNRYVRLTSDNRVFIKLPAELVLKGRTMVGYINSLEDQPVALFDRFFLGGINTLRGFDLNSVGPQITVPSTPTGGDDRFVFGGTKMILFNTELEVPLYAPAGFYAVAFFDSGNAFAEDENIDLTRLRSNYGFGIRWQSPFGPLRFEWGLPINKRSGDSDVVFNFSIGQSF